MTDRFSRFRPWEKEADCSIRFHPQCNADMTIHPKQLPATTHHHRCPALIQPSSNNNKKTNKNQRNRLAYTHSTSIANKTPATRTQKRVAGPHAVHTLQNLTRTSKLFMNRHLVLPFHFSLHMSVQYCSDDHTIINPHTEPAESTGYLVSAQSFYLALHNYC